jgi:Protein of unknown function (DUF2637)
MKADPLLANPCSTGSAPSVSQTARPLTNIPTRNFGGVGRFRSPNATAQHGCSSPRGTRTNCLRGRALRCLRFGRHAVNANADRWIRRTTTCCVALLAVIAGTVSYLHMHLLVELHGHHGWVAALTPLSVDGMIVAASTTLLADSRSGGRGRALSWLLLGAGSVASLAANVALAEPTVTGRVIAAWPSFALIGSYELLMRQIRATAAASGRRPAHRSAARAANSAPARGASAGRVRARKGLRSASRSLRTRPSRGPWLIGTRTAGFRAAGPSRTSSAATSDGAGWLSITATQLRLE